MGSTIGDMINMKTDKKKRNTVIHSNDDSGGVDTNGRFEQIKDSLSIHQKSHSDSTEFGFYKYEIRFHWGIETKIAKFLYLNHIYAKFD